jgi:hypothetical protein
MSRQEKDKNDKLRELLNSKENEPAGEFEREALEGFAMLGDEESLKLKREVDAKMPGILSTPAARNRNYLALAAALVLIVAISVLFLLVNSEKKTSDLAVTNSIERRNEQLMSPPPAAEPVQEDRKAAAEKNEAPQKRSEPKKEQPALSERAPAPEQKSEGAASEMQETEKSAAAVAVADRSEKEEPREHINSTQPRADTMSFAVAGQARLENAAEPAVKKKDRMARGKSQTTPEAPAAAVYRDDELTADKAAKNSLPLWMEELKKELKKSNLDVPFKARLYLDSGGSVKRAEFITKPELKAEDQKALKKIVEKRKDVKPSGIENGVQFYDLDYRP